MNTSVWRKYLAWSVAGIAVWWLVYRSLASIAAWFTYSLLGMAHGSHLAAAVEFFVVVIAIVSGWMIGRLRLEKYVEDWVYQTQTGNPVCPNKSQALIYTDK